MPAIILDGKALSCELEQQLGVRVTALKQKLRGEIPMLATILVGGDPATPGGIMTMLKHHKLPVAGKEAVVVGRSPILGKPMAAMLLNANATVIICHSKTQDLPGLIRRADIVVGAVGKPEFIKAAWIKD